MRPKSFLGELSREIKKKSVSHFSFQRRKWRWHGAIDLSEAEGDQTDLPVKRVV